jgi:enterochelin esterase family protein
MLRATIFALVLLTGICQAEQSSGDFKPASTNVWGAEYPRVDDAGRVQIRI